MRLFALRTRRDPAPTHIDVAHEGDRYRVALRRSAVAKRFTLRVSAAKREVTLTMPQRGSLAVAADFAARHGGWIAERLKRLDAAIDCVPGAVIPFRGIPHLIEHRPEARGTVWVETGPGGETLLVVAGRPEHARRRVADFLKHSAREDLDRAVARHTTRLGIPARKITLKDTTSRWGSCSSSGRLNFSWRLVLAPPEILDYLAAHEVAHLKELNHSARFWRVVSDLFPTYKAAEAWLKRNGAGLHRYR